MKDGLGFKAEEGLLPALWHKTVCFFDGILTPIFGKSWKPSLFALIAFLSEASQQILDWCKDYGFSEKWLHVIAWVFLMIALFHAKGSQVTGGTEVQSSVVKKEDICETDCKKESE